MTAVARPSACGGWRTASPDSADWQSDDAAGTWTRRAIELGVDALVLAWGLPDHARRQALDHGGDAWRAEALVELAPADDAVFGRQLERDEVAPRTADDHFGIDDLHNGYHIGSGGGCKTSGVNQR